MPKKIIMYLFNFATTVINSPQFKKFKTTDEDSMFTNIIKINNKNDGLKKPINNKVIINNSINFLESPYFF